MILKECKNFVGRVYVKLNRALLDLWKLSHLGWF